MPKGSAYFISKGADINTNHGHAPTWWPYSTTSETTSSTPPTYSCVPLLICRPYEMSLRSCMLFTIIILLDFLDMLRKPLYPFSYMYQCPVINPRLMRPLLILTMGPLLHLGLSVLLAFMCNVILLMQSHPQVPS